MDLFDHNEVVSLLPNDGEVLYYGSVFGREESERYLNLLLAGIAWKNDEAVIFGRHIVTRRKVAWYGDESYPYTYSGKTRVALPWTKDMLGLKRRVEHMTGADFNSCLLNLYHDGEDGMSWHSDDERALGKNSTIASLSFGAERKFSLKHRESKEVVSLILENGSLLVMKNETQQHWLHALPKTKKVRRPRVNLTFRNML